MAGNYDDFFRDGVGKLRDHGFNPYPERLHIRIQNAREQMIAGLHYYLGNRAKWLPCYDEIADWLTDNKDADCSVSGIRDWGRL